MKIMHDDKKIRGIIATVDDLETEKATLSDVETLLASGDVEDIKAGSIIENMEGYTFSPSSNPSVSTNYASVVKNGNKITFVISGVINSDTGFSVGDTLVIGIFNYPAAIGAKLVPNVGTNRIGYKGFRICVNTSTGANCNSFFTINSGTSGYFSLGFVDAVSANSSYYFRFEETFLLSENMIPNP